LTGVDMCFGVRVL